MRLYALNRHKSLEMIKAKRDGLSTEHIAAVGRMSHKTLNAYMARAREILELQEKERINAEIECREERELQLTAHEKEIMFLYYGLQDAVAKEIKTHYSTIKDASKDDWKAAKYLLWVLDPDTYSEKHRVEVNNLIGVITINGVAITQDELDKFNTLVIPLFNVLDDEIKDKQTLGRILERIKSVYQSSSEISVLSDSS